jgi:hypothetical protein
MLFLIKLPTETGQSHSSVKFACPDVHAREAKIPPAQALLAAQQFGATPFATSPSSFRRLVLDRDSLTLRRVNCGGARRPARPTVRCDRLISSGDSFTFAAEFIN